MTDDRRPSRAALVGVVVFLVFLGAGLLLGRTRHHRENDVASPGDAVAVLQPSGYGDENLANLPGLSPPLQEPGHAATTASVIPVADRTGSSTARAGSKATEAIGTPDPTGSTGSTSPPATTAAPDPASTTTGPPDAPSTSAGSPSTTATTGSTASTATTTRAAGASSSTTPGGPRALGDLPALATGIDLRAIAQEPGVVRLLDACVGGGDGCPRGVSGTILAGEREPLEILEGTGAVSPARFALYDECVRTLRHPDARAAILAVISNHPARFTFAGAWTGTATTSTRARDRWQADRDRGDIHRVVSCAVLAPAGRRGEIRIDGVDDLGATARLVTIVDAVALDHKRPPISVTPTGDMTLRLTVPVRANETAEVLAHTRTDDTPGGPNDCGENVVPRVHSTATQTVVALPTSLLGLGGYPYDRAWDRVALVDLRLTEGSVPYDLCVRWLSRVRSFETPQLVDAEARLLLPPTRNDLQVSVAGVMPGRNQPIDTRRLVVDLKTAEGTPGCTFAVGSPGFPLATGPDRYPTAVPMCLIHTGRTGEWSGSTVTHQGVERRADLRLSNRVCHTGSTPIRPCAGSFTEWYSLVVPKPTGGDSGGVVLLRFDYSVPHAGPDALSESSFFTQRDTFGVFPGGQVTLPSGDAVGFTTTQPLLDTFATTVRPEGDAQGQSVLVVQWVADRPVIVTAAVEGNDPDTCSRDPRPEASSTEPATTGTLRLEGLCAGTRSGVGLMLRTPTGETSSYSDVAGVHADRVGPGFTATTHGIPLTISPAVLFGDVAAHPPGSVIRSALMVVQANGQTIINAQLSLDLHQGVVPPRLDQFPCSSLAAFRFTPASHLSPDYPIPPSPRPMLWPEDVYISVFAHVNISADPCGQPDGHSVSFRRTDFHEYGFTVTTAGAGSVLLTPSGTHGTPPPPPGSSTWTAEGGGLIVQLNAHAG